MEIILRSYFFYQLRLFLFIASIISIFIPLQVYICLFVLFTISQFLSQISLGKMERKLVFLVLFVYSFLIVASFSHLSNYSVSDSTQFIKMWVNLNFLIASISFIRQNYLSISINFLKCILELIIVVSFVQIISNVLIMDLFMMPFYGVENSVVAYNIVIPTVYFGTTEKNIWATKIAFIQIVYMAINNLYPSRNRSFKYYMFLIFMLINIIYTFSRTAQLAFIVPLVFFTLNINVKLNKVLKLIWQIVFILIIIFSGAFLYDKLFHITLESGDGLFGRLILWQAFYDNLYNLNWLWGNGILYTKYLVIGESLTNNNLHNVFLNMFLDVGFLGLFFYLAIIYRLFNDINTNEIKYIKIWGFFAPFFITINSQYLGYDNDLIVFHSLMYFFFIKTLSLK